VAAPDRALPVAGESAQIGVTRNAWWTAAAISNENPVRQHNPLRISMMKRIAVVAAVAGLLSSVVASAADKPAIGYVDVRAVLMESKAGKQHKADMDKFVKDKQAALQKEEEKLKSLQQTLEKEVLTLTDAQKQDKQRGFQEKVQALQKTAQEAERELRQKDADYTNKALEEIRKIIAATAKEEKLILVLGKTEMSVLYAEDGMDLTPKVIQKHDSRSGKK
jgi:outer membrane protein